MIIKSHIRGGYRAAANYLKQEGANEKIRLVAISDPDARSIDDAFRNMWMLGKTTRATKPLHHVSINPMKDERLTDAQVLRVCQRLEEKYGYRPGEHQRVIVEHIKDGRQHFHVMWHRVSLGSGQVVWPGHHWKKSRQAAREMEVELGLKRPTPRKPWVPQVGLHRISSIGKRHVLSRSSLDMPKPSRPLQSTRRSVCISGPAPRPHPIPRRPKRHTVQEELREPVRAIDTRISREELIAWAWENSRFDILAQFGIYVSPDP